ncbi:hypothetical protein SAMD00019534_124100, partial [Acytostelium subglobosum LB1]|uniref:hypothetical protein n=1 Tax=Acytostelium subglobosum LB1 TaxID=1410327 RepID=UPI0006449E04
INHLHNNNNQQQLPTYNTLQYNTYSIPYNTNNQPTNHRTRLDTRNPFPLYCWSNIIINQNH